MTLRHPRWSIALAVAGTAALAILVAPSGEAAAGMRAKATLAATGVDANARGQAAIGIRGHDGTFDLKANRLDGGAAYDVIVDGVRVTTLQTTRGGTARVRFRSRPRGKNLLLGFDPRGTSVSVRDGAGHDVLVGSLPADTVDPTAIACCVPDDENASECEELTADACTAAGGTATQAATCIPDPCAPVTPPVTTVCCTNETDDDESESECEDDSATECTAAGGIVVEAASCEPNPCAPTTPPAGDAVACCVPEDEGESECEVRTTEACAAMGGTAMGVTSCDPDPCPVGSGSGDDDGSDDGDSGGGESDD
jgi:hypothetical protein